MIIDTIHKIVLIISLVITFHAAYTDIKEGIILNRITVGGMIIGIIINCLYLILGYKTKALWAAVGFLIYFTVTLFLGTFLNAIGGGDIKLFGALALILGFSGITFIFLMSNIFGAIAGIILIIFGKAKLKSRIRFAPYIALATVFYSLLTFINHWPIIII